MKNLYSIATLSLLLLLFSCAKDESLLQSAEMAPLFQHWALEFDNDVVTGVPYSEQYPDANEMTTGYEFFKNGKGVDYSFKPHAMFTYEINMQGTDKVIVIRKSVPTVLVNNNYTEGHCQNNLSNGSGCNNTANFNATPELSIAYETKTESFRIAELTKVHLQGYMVN
ncbi:MAG: hypothetical protein K9J37_06425 [Saprospiraceae bacterium]|nr:hypothetical protein [Saprospiraceae bacterium]MCF8249528.1 hypothetical protein [Saprospiraceae bacterium]MCF8281278.1 hypothetical protein [Bacteroidales bacterium]MCF8310746.1 hypothetical protein [Saprospiraceae bacterium]MCF8439423.1 hypothetical protein [Saprospiraceae bacterium]